MKTSCLICLAVLLFIFSHDVFPVHASGQYCGYEADAQFLADNFSKLYSEDYSGFWLIFNRVAKEAVACTNAEDTAGFLVLAKQVEGNAEVTEAFMHVMEEGIFEKNAECLVNALTMVDAHSARVILDDLKNPMYIDESFVRNKMQGMSVDGKRAELVREYFK
ncbi:hypothetical protein [Fundidesulfovibrio agrisoli]|uniref:hypothetical protein n=1 Tax=Fundidesulfovibrio agrisoli TaxID=2922717 RepID=UPI001FAC2241|nr:hypothetical protein [Fundidesulfovibrio agrisoli]